MTQRPPQRGIAILNEVKDLVAILPDYPCDAP
jgi:hypothetical protein